MAAERYLSRRIPDLRVGNNIDEIDKKLIPASIHPCKTASSLRHKHPRLQRRSLSKIHLRDMFHVYLNRFEFHFLRLHIIKTNKFCLFMNNRRVLGIAKQTRWHFIA